MAGVPPSALGPTWACRGVVEAAVPGEAAGLVAEALPVDPVQPPAVGEAGGVPARAAEPRLDAAGQGPGPQPRQRVQRQPQGSHSEHFAAQAKHRPSEQGLRSSESGCPRTAAAARQAQLFGALPRAQPPPRTPPLPAGRVLWPPRPRWGALSPEPCNRC